MLARAVAALIAAPVLAAIATQAPALAATPAQVMAGGGGTPPAACGAAGYPAGYGIWCPGRVRLVIAGDSLWALAQRYLGDGARWPEIWILGTTVPRQCGSSANPPGQIFPGQILLIPAAGQATAPAWCQPGTWQPEPSTAPPRGSPRAAAPARTGSSAAARLLPDVALAAAALGVGAALAFTVRRRGTRPGARRPARWPRPRLWRPATGRAGSRPNLRPRGPDPQLWLPDGRRDPQPRWPGRPGWPAASPELPAPARRVWSPALGTGAPDMARGPGEIPVGIRGQQEAAAGIAALQGVGLTGPGAEAAARAMLATVLSLARPSPPGLPAPVIVAADTGILPVRAGAPRTVLAQPPSLAAALDLTEALILQLARLSGDDPDASPPSGTVPAALFASPGPDDEPRLRGITAAGQDLGLIVVILGTWTYGTTCHVAADGTITAVTPPAGDLEGVRLFQLGARDLLAVAAAIGEQDQPAAAHDYAVPGRAAESEGTWQAQAAGDQSPGAGQAAPLARIGVLGPLQISAGGQDISAGFRKSRELLAFLAVCGPQGASSDTVTEALWPEAAPGHGARQRNTALRKARDLLRAHAGTPGVMWILFAGDRYRLDPDLISVDLWEFRAALDAARDAPGDAGRLAAFRQAAGLYRGPLCEGAGYEWAEQYAEAARRSVLDAWTRTAELLQDTDPEQALAALEAAAATDPHNEDTYLQIMRLQIAAGRADAARRTYQLLLTRLRELDLTGPRPAIRLAAAGLLGETGPQPAGPPRASARRGS